MYQGARDEARRINQYLPADVKSADAVILSHGHLDHCGKLPVMTRAGFAGPIYCTPATAEVARVVLGDSAVIAMEDAQYLNQRARGPQEPPVAPLYTPDDIPNVLRLMQRVDYAQKTSLGKGVSFTFYDAGHILGSAYVLLEWIEAGRNRTLLFTGDIGRYNTPIIRDPFPLPMAVEQVITESTYGNTQHAPMADVGPQLLDALKYCVEHKSRLLVPSFALGRTQTVLYYMQQFISQGKAPEVPIFIDSPMGVAMSQIHSKFRDLYDDETRAAIGTKDLFGMSRVTFAASVTDSKKINAQQGACVIIASSPTCEFGRILHHLTLSVDRPNDVVVFVGWIPQNTLGRKLQQGIKRVSILDRWYDVKCQIRTIHGLSAHADGDELLRFLSPTLRKETAAYVVHGEVDQAEGFARRLLKKGLGRATVPAMESSVIDDAQGGGVPGAAPQPVKPEAGE